MQKGEFVGLTRRKVQEKLILGRGFRDPSKFNSS
jgi:hypothetical protein